MRFPTQTAFLALALLAGALQRITEAAPAAANGAPLAGALTGDPNASSSHLGRVEHANLIEGAALAAGSLADAETAPTPAEPNAAGTQEAAAQTDVSCRYVGPLPELAGPTRLAGFRQRVAEIELLVDIDREFEEAERQLDLLRTYATASPEKGGQPWEGQAEAVVLITTRLAELQLARRAPERAVRTLKAVLPVRPLAGLAQDAQFEPADRDVLQREAAWLADPRVVALLARAEAQLERRRDSASPAASAPVADELTDEIWRDLQVGKGELVRAMGTAAVPALHELTLRSITGIDPAAVADQARDPLYYLVRYSPSTALDVILPNLEETPLIWRKRIVRAMKLLGVMVHSRREAGDRLKLDEPRWLDVLDGLVVDPQLWEDLLQLLEFQSQYSDWTPVQAAAVRSRLLGDDVAAARALRVNGPWKTQRPHRDKKPNEGVPLVEGMRQLELLEAGLLAESMEVREMVAFFLARTEMPLSFLGRLDGASAAVQLSLLAACRGGSGWGRAFLGPRKNEVIDALFTLAEAPDVEVRRAAADQLSNPRLRDDVDARRLLVFTKDPDAEVRGAVFTHLQANDKDRHPTTEAEFELVRALAFDSDPTLRYSAVNIAQLKGEPLRFTREELLALSEDSARDVRSQVPWFPIEDTALAVELYRRLAMDPDERVLQSVDNRVERALREDETKVGAYLPYFEARLADPAQPVILGAEHPGRVATQFLGTTEGLRLALAHVQAQPEHDGLAALLRFLQRTSNQGDALIQACLAIPAPELEFLLYGIGAEKYRPTNLNGRFLYQNLANALEGSDRENVGVAMSGASVDAKVDRLVRNYAFGWRMRFQPESSTGDLIAYLGDLGWAGYDFGNNDSGSSLRSLADAIDPDVRNAVALRVIRTPEIGDYLAATVTDKYYPERPGGVEVSRAMLKRFLTLETTHSRASTALRHLGGVPGEVEPALLKHALKIDNVDSIALGCIAQLKDPQYLPALLECLNPTWIGYHETRHAFAMETAFAISQFMTDEASEVLLEGVQIAETEEVRQACFDALERIRLYQEARERIGRREVGKEKRDGAVRELVAMLDDGDAGTVAAAIKSLAALGAVDELPALIRLRKHADAGVRAAAEAAIERLTAPAEGLPK